MPGLGGPVVPSAVKTPQAKGRIEAAIRHLVDPPRWRGTSTPRLPGSIIDVSGILDHPPARVMTTERDDNRTDDN